MKSITPFIIGSGSAGKAMAESFAVAAIRHPELCIAPAAFVPRGGLSLMKPRPSDIICIANPHARHAQAILDAVAAGFTDIIVEKPACVAREDLSRLTDVRANVAVCHGYRVMWGPETLKKMMASGEFGDLISIEGRYWQSSAAVRAVEGTKKDGWKNSVDLNGRFDTLVDLGAHWVDLVLSISKSHPKVIEGWVSYANAEAPHRDTHVHVNLDFGTWKSFGSISKTVHGAGNHLEICVLGTKGAARWEFINADQIHWAQGPDATVISRTSHQPTASGHAPFHALGWLEGYVEVLTRACLRKAGKSAGEIPSLQQNLEVVGLLLDLADHH